MNLPSMRQLLLIAFVVLPRCGSRDDAKKDEQNLTEPTPTDNANTQPPPAPPTDGNKGEDSQGQPQARPPLPPAGMTASEHGAYFLKIEWLAGPTAEAESRIRFIFNGADGKIAASVANTTFKPWMTIHGHGAPERSIRINAESGFANQYIISGVYFSMSGPWDLKISSKVNGVEDSITLPVSVP